jgi:uncharacterized protein (TIGR02147 family)
MAQPYFQSCLREEFAKRTDKNPRYSLRAFARALNLVPSALSEILNGKRFPSYKMAEKILGVIELEPEHRERFISSLAHSQKNRNGERLNPIFRNISAVEPKIDELSLDLFRIISDWYHSAILELTFTKNFKQDTDWIASQLGISRAEAKLAVDRLFELGLLEEVRGKWKKSKEQLTSADKHMTNAALRKLQRQALEIALGSLENDPIENRSNTTMTMAINESKLPEAKKLISRFNRDLCALLETGSQERVYNLTIALNPIQKKII